MGNRSFREKRDAERGFRDSPLRLNEDLRQAERWDEPAIRARAARLAALAVDIWRRPVLTDRVLASYETPRADAGRYTIEHHPHLRPGAPMHDLFEAVRQSILALGPQVREEVRKHYVAYKTQTNFVDLVPQKRRLLLSLNMRFDELSDPRGLAADITNLGAGAMAMSRWSWITNARSPMRWTSSARPSRPSSRGVRRPTGAMRRRRDAGGGDRSPYPTVRCSRAHSNNCAVSGRH